MSEGSGPWLIVGGFVLAALLLLLDLALSVALLSVGSLSRVAVRRLAVEESSGKLRFLEELKRTPSTYRMATQLARQMSLLSGSVLVGLTARAAGWRHPWFLSLLCGSVLGVVILETFTARVLAHRDPRAALRITAHLIRPIHALTYPFLAPLQAIFGGSSPSPQQEEDREEEQEEEVEAYIEVGEREGILEADEGKMMRSIVYLGDTLVREIMTPRTDIVALPAEATVAQARRVLLEAAHTRFPVYRDTIDNTVGILQVRDLVRAWEEGKEDSPITGYVRPAFFVPETQSVAELIREMRIRTHIALVVDEYGGIAGLVTLEDLLEEIVGDIRDEHDVEEALVQEGGDGSWLVSGMAHVEQLEDLFDLEVGEREFDTVGGLVVSKLGRVPSQGETFEAYGLSIEVVEADPRRVYRVRLRKADPAGPVGAAP